MHYWSLLQYYEAQQYQCHEEVQGGIEGHQAGGQHQAGPKESR